MVVPVLMTSCQVSLKPNNGPLSAHTRMTPTATKNVTGRPDAWAVHLVNRVNHERDLVGLMVPGCYHSRTMRPTKSRSWFTRLTKWTAHASGRPVTFFVAVGVILVWALSGPLFGFSDTWQLVINTGTTIV